MLCRHDYKPWANIYGDLINDTNSRTVLMCPKCGKRRFIGPYLEAPVNYNFFLEFAARVRNHEDFIKVWEQVGPFIVKDPDTYLQVFGRKDIFGKRVESYKDKL